MCILHPNKELPTFEYNIFYKRVSKMQFKYALHKRNYEVIFQCIITHDVNKKSFEILLGNAKNSQGYIHNN